MIGKLETILKPHSFIPSLCVSLCSCHMSPGYFFCSRPPSTAELPLSSQPASAKAHFSQWELDLRTHLTMNLPHTETEKKD